MAGLMIYLPGYDGNDPKELTARGLGDLLDPIVDLIPTPVRSGPDGGEGVLVTFCGGVPDSPREVNLELQEWREAPPNGELAKGRYWLGYVKAAKPMPDDLRRKEICDGELVTLADARQWVVPIADYLPMRLTFDPDTGAEVTVPEDRHKKFTDEANELFAHFVSDYFHEVLKEQHVVTVPGGLAFAGLALSKNYRVNAFAVDLLELIGQSEAFEVARVATGMSLIERGLAQKKSPALSSPQV